MECCASPSFTNLSGRPISTLLLYSLATEKCHAFVSFNTCQFSPRWDPLHDDVRPSRCRQDSSHVLIFRDLPQRSVHAQQIWACLVGLCGYQSAASIPWSLLLCIFGAWCILAINSMCFWVSTAGPAAGLPLNKNGHVGVLQRT